MKRFKFFTKPKPIFSVPPHIKLNRYDMIIFANGWYSYQIGETEPNIPYFNYLSSRMIFRAGWEHARDRTNQRQ